MKSKWNEKEARKFIKEYNKKGVSRELALRIYTTRLLGNNSQLVLHGGGNTSLKLSLKNSFGKKENIIFVKGSGKDMSNIDIDGFPALELDNLIKLKKLKKISDFQMVNYQKKYMIDTTFPNASVETLLHSFLPHKYVDHTHSNAILSLIDQPMDKNICKKIFGENLAIVPYIMPGFKLAKKSSEVFKKNPKVKGLILLNHGIFTFGNTAKQSYERMIKFVSVAERELKRKSRKIKKNLYIEKKVTPSNLSNIIRKYISIPLDEDYQRKIICYSNSLFINQFFHKNVFTKINGPVTPDHVIRIKHKPLFLDFTKIKSDKIEQVIKKKLLIIKKNILIILIVTNI